MKALVVARYAQRRGGADTFTQDFCLNLVKHQHAVEIICHGHSAEVARVCRIHQLPEPDFSNLSGLWRLSTYLYMRHWVKYLAAVRAFVPDVIVCSLPLAIGALQKRYPKTPLIYLPHSRIAPIEAVHGRQPHSLMDRITFGVYYATEKRALRRAAATVRFTQGNVTALQQYYRVESNERFCVIPPAIVLPAEAERPPRDQHFFRFLVIGRLVGEKNVHSLLHWLKRLRRTEWRLDIVGEGPQRATLEAEAKALFPNGQVRFHGFQESTAMHYCSADLMLFPSVRESFGLVIVEAMAHGTPTLAMRPHPTQYDTFSDEIITHGSDGLLANDERDFISLASACIDGTIETRKLGTAAKRTAVERYSWDSCVARWQDLVIRQQHAGASGQCLSGT